MRKIIEIAGLILIIVVLGRVFLLGIDKSNKNIDTIQTAPTSAPSLANPASINCAKQGGKTIIMTLGNGGQYGLCQFDDNMSCEEWAMMRGQCPIGGVKTTGYDTIQQKYCAWIGGKTFAVENAKCTLPNGTVCSDDALYNGTCPSTDN